MQVGGEGYGNGVAMLIIGAAILVLVVSMYAASRRIRSPGAGGSRWWGRVRALLHAVPTSPLECSASMRLTPRHSLHVVEWEGRRLLVGCGDQAICLVAESPPEGRA